MTYTRDDLDLAYRDGEDRGRQYREHTILSLIAERDMLRAQLDHIMKHLSLLDALKPPAPFLVVINQEKNGAAR